MCSRQRLHQIILIVGLIGFSWPLMMLVHECGHMLGALATGGRVTQLVWYPTVFSRTDVRPNPAPLAVVWAGPMFGAVVPAAISLVLSPIRWPLAYMLNFFAGFCLLANGLYIGIGVFGRVGDSGDMLRLGMAAWTLFAFGLFTAIPGLYLLNRVSPRLGFGKSPSANIPAHALGAFAFAIIVLLIGFGVGNPG
jgi:hypothetical protein